MHKYRMPTIRKAGKNTQMYLLKDKRPYKLTIINVQHVQKDIPVPLTTLMFTNKDFSTARGNLVIAIAT